jgi:hypothetical protein
MKGPDNVKQLIDTRYFVSNYFVVNTLQSPMPGTSMIEDFTLSARGREVGNSNLTKHL